MSPLLRALRSRFARDAATLQASGLINQISQAVSTVWIARLLGAEGQGLFVSAVALQGLFYVTISVGLTQATVSQVAAAGARGKRAKVAGWLAFLVKALAVFGAVLALGGWLALPRIAEVLYDDGATGERIAFWAWLLCFQVLLELPRIVCGVAFQGTRRMGHLGAIENGHELARLACVVAGATASGDAGGAVAGSLVASALGSLLALFSYRRARRADDSLLPPAAEVLAAIPSVPLIAGVRMGLRVGIVKNMHTFFVTLAPRLAIGSVAGVDWVAYFHIAQRILQIPLMFLLGVSRTLLPALSEQAGLRDLPTLRRLFTRVTLVSGTAVALGVLGAMPFVPPLVRALFPPGYAEPVWTYYWILALGYLPYAFGTGIEAFYLATNNVKWWIGLSFFGLSYSIPIHLWLILNVPVTGTAWGMLCYHSFVLAHLAYIAWWFRRQGAECAWRPASEPPGPG